MTKHIQQLSVTQLTTIQFDYLMIILFCWRKEKWQRHQLPKRLQISLLQAQPQCLNNQTWLTQFIDISGLRHLCPPVFGLDQQLCIQFKIGIVKLKPIQRLEWQQFYILDFSLCFGICKLTSKTLHLMATFSSYGFHPNGFHMIPHSMPTPPNMHTSSAKIAFQDHLGRFRTVGKILLW